MKKLVPTFATVTILAALAGTAAASSHREAPYLGGGRGKRTDAQPATVTTTSTTTPAPSTIATTPAATPAWQLVLAVGAAPLAVSPVVVVPGFGWFALARR